MLPAMLLPLFGGCFVEFSPLPIDAGRTETAVPDWGADHAQVLDGPLADKAPNWLQPFLGSSWVHPVDKEVTAKLLIESLHASERGIVR